MLLQFAKKLRAQHAVQTDQSGTQQPVGALTVITPYEQLRYAEVEGIGTVTIDYTGNMVGFSPVERCTIGGETAWIPLELLRNLRTTPFVAGTPAAARARTLTSAAPTPQRTRSRSRRAAKPQQAAQ